MKIVLFGGGAMGRLVSTRAKDDGDEISLVLTSKDATRPPEELVDLLRGHDAAIDFSVSDAVLANVTACAQAGIPLVEGTTGWNKHESEVREVVDKHGGALIYGANFSIGVNLFYGIVARAAELFQRLPDYAPFIEEAHHSRKRDAPSGTALKLRDILASMGLDPPIASTRAGHIPGIHRVAFDSVSDQVLLTHTARSREGFATGSLVAARWIQGRRGTFEFSTMIDEILNARRE
jgi:4-hydroxy-tetrahydrodipicolinate reductase